MIEWNGGAKRKRCTPTYGIWGRTWQSDDITSDRFNTSHLFIAWFLEAPIPRVHKKHEQISCTHMRISIVPEYLIRRVHRDWKFEIYIDTQRSRRRRRLKKKTNQNISFSSTIIRTWINGIPCCGRHSSDSASHFIEAFLVLLMNLLMLSFYVCVCICLWKHPVTILCVLFYYRRSIIVLHVHISNIIIFYYNNIFAFWCDGCKHISTVQI